MAYRIGKLCHPLATSMKKLLAVFLALSVILSMANVGMAWGTYQAGDKNLLADGNMEAATTGSYEAFNIIASKQTTSPYSGKQLIRVAYDGSNVQGGARQVILVSGNTYHVTGWARGDGTARPAILVGGASEDWPGTNSTAWQRIDITTVSDGVSLYLFSYNQSATHYVEFDDVQVTLYNGQSAMNKNLLADGNMEATNAAVALVDGDMEAATATTTDGGAWSAFQIYASKSTASPHGGSSALRISYSGFESGLAYQPVVTVGHTYHVTAWVRGDGTSLPQVAVGNVNFTWGTTSTAWQYIDFTQVTVGDENFRLQASSLSAGHWVEFDDITITDVTAGSWTAGNSAIASKQTTSPYGGKQVLKIAHNGTNSPYVLNGTLVVGKRYKATGWARSDGNCLPYLADASLGVFWTGTNSTAWQRIDSTLVATGAAPQFVSLNCTVAGQYTEWDDMQVTEYSAPLTMPKNLLADGNMESTNAAVALVDGNMESASTSSWAVTNITLTKDTTTPHSGTRNMRLTYSASAIGYASQGILTSGKTYRVTGWARGDGTGTGIPLVEDDNGAHWTGTNSNSWQAIDVTYIQGAGGADFVLLGSSLSATHYVEFDDITITDVTAGSYIIANSIVSKNTTSPHGGNQVIRVAFDGTNATGYASQVVIEAGKSYHIIGWARGDGTAYPRLLDGYGGLSWVGTDSVLWQRIDYVGTALYSRFDLFAQGLSAGKYVEFDDVMVSEY